MLAVLKVGGSVLEEPDPQWVGELSRLVGEGHRAVVVHGGGARISRALTAAREPVRFVRGQRVTTPSALTTVVRVLAGEVNAELVLFLLGQGLPAVGLAGFDGGMLRARVVDPELGRVGGALEGDPALLHSLLQLGRVPVVAPLAEDCEQPGSCLNVNGDFAAAAVAACLGADWLVFYTDVGGVRADPADPATTLDRISVEQAQALIDRGIAGAGMVPKLEAAAHALAGGVGAVRIGRLYGTPVGTTVVAAADRRARLEVRA